MVDGRRRFVVIGVTKAGTTSLYHYCSDHPEICMTRPKEPPTWDASEEGVPDLSRYESAYLSHCTDEVLLGESNPAHCSGDTREKAERLHDVFPDTTVVVLLRDPVQRAFSHWWHWRCMGSESGTFSEAATPDSPYVRQGEYLRILRDYERVFSRKSIQVVFSADLFDRTEATVRNLYRTLGVDESHVPGTERAYNTAWNHPWVHELVGLLSKMRIVPALPEPVRRLGRSVLSRFGSKPAMRDRDHNRLTSHYRRENDGLEDWVGRSLPWRNG